MYSTYTYIWQHGSAVYVGMVVLPIIIILPVLCYVCDLLYWSLISSCYKHLCSNVYTYSYFIDLVLGLSVYAFECADIIHYSKHCIISFL